MSRCAPMPSPRLPRRDRLAFRVLGLLTGEAEGALAIGVLAVLVVVVVVLLRVTPWSYPLH